MRYTKKLVKEMLAENPEMMYFPMPEEIRQLFPVVTVDIASDIFGLHFTTNHTAKMAGIDSISTTCKYNPDCLKRIEAAFRLVIPGFVLSSVTLEDVKKARTLLDEYIKNDPESKKVSICGFCFSDRQQDFMQNMQPSLKRNHEILNNGIIHSDWLPIINSLYFRIESFGDFASINAVINILNLIKKNSRVFFGVWIKNPKYFHAVFAGDPARKPENCNIILSSQFINRAAVIPEIYRYFIDKTFTVYSGVYAENNSVCINCGAKSCLNCLKCYTKNNQSVINEKLK